MRLADLPPELLAHILVDLPLRDLESANATARLFRSAHGGRSPVELALRERAGRRGPAHAPPAALPAGVGTWTHELLARERVHALACAHALAVAVQSNAPFDLQEAAALSAFVDAEGGLHTCGEEATGSHDVPAYAPCEALGHPGLSEVLVPTRVASLSAVRMRSVAAGYGHLLALSDAGAVYACGVNGYGQLGLGDRATRHSFVAVHALGREAAVCVVTHDAHSLALTAAGSAYSWGRNSLGQLGHGDQHNRWEPTRIEALDGVRVGAAACGLEHTLLLGTDGAVYSCGDNSVGQLGDGLSPPRSLGPARIQALAGVRAVHVSAGAMHSLVIDASGGVRSFGGGGAGGLGRAGGGGACCPLPERIEALAGVRAVRASCGGSSSAVVGADGSVHTFGITDFAQLGRGHSAICVSPQPCVLTSRRMRVVGCSLSRVHALFVTLDGAVYSCGMDSAALGHGLSLAAADDRPMAHLTHLVTWPARIAHLRVAWMAAADDAASHLRPEHR